VKGGLQVGMDLMKANLLNIFTIDTNMYEKVLLRSWVDGECVMYMSNYDFANKENLLDPDLDINV